MAAPEVVMMTTSGAANDDKVGINATFTQNYTSKNLPVSLHQPSPKISNFKPTEYINSNTQSKYDIKMHPLVPMTSILILLPFIRSQNEKGI